LKVWIKFILSILFFFPLYGQLRLKRVYFLQSGLYNDAEGNVICWDTDHNGLNEVIFQHGSPLRWEIWEYRPFNQYELVFVDTGAHPSPPGINTRKFRPYDIGDIDQDSLTDLVGPNEVRPPDTSGIFYNVVTTQESPNYTSYPESLSWWYRYGNYNEVQSAPFYFPIDLDQDERRELLFLAEGIGITHIFENRGNNQNELVWNRFRLGAFLFAFGDFDLDGRKEFVTADLGSLGRVSVYENTGDDQYEMTFQDTVRLPNGLDVFSGNDLDQDGKPEFFVAFAVVGATFYLYMWEATGNNTYQRTLVDQKTIPVSYTTGRRSKCGDLDGDGIEELVWATPTYLFVYKATGNNQFQQVWQWYQDHGTDECLVVNIFDMNKNGYNEIVVGGSGKTSIFEVEAVKVLRPNGGENFSGGSQEIIRWQTFYPPRCDSLSIFFSSDNGRTYETIATGIPGTDTSYLWTVPNISSDSCKVKVIAYGPGWQYDESDNVFSIAPVGIEERKIFAPQKFNLTVQPNLIKGNANIKLSIPEETEISLIVSDISGKKVKTIIQKDVRPGNYKISWDGNDDSNKRLPSGVYFLILKSRGKEVIRKALLLR